MRLKELKEKLQAALLAARALCDAAEEAKRDFTDEERGKVAGYMAEARSTSKRIQRGGNDRRRIR